MIRIEPQTSFNIVWERNQHKSQTVVKCILDKESGEVKLVSAVCTQGNIIPLDGIRKALIKAKNEFNKPNVPIDTA